MRVKCPTCGGVGTINDPKSGPTMCYSGPNGEICPQVVCQTCGSTGWVEVSDAVALGK